MKVFIPVEKDEAVFDGLFDFYGRMVYSNLEEAIQVEFRINDDPDWSIIMEGELVDDKEIVKYVCECLNSRSLDITGFSSKLKVKWIASHVKQLCAA